jgi:catechol 2,3-dioxygenase-like lactoylglutathione lyase family enzyme
MIDHTAVNVSDLDTGKRFYEAPLRPLGYALQFEVDDFLGFGDRPAPSFGVVRRDRSAAARSRSPAPIGRRSTPSTRPRSRRARRTTAARRAPLPREPLRGFRPRRRWLATNIDSMRGLLTRAFGRSRNNAPR